MPELLSAEGTSIIQKSTTAKDHSITWDTITGIASSSIALCALCLAIWQGFVIRRHNKISVRPHLTTWMSYNTKANKYIFEIMNNGIGPAIIKEFVLKVDNKPIDGKDAKPIKKVLQMLFEPYFKYGAKNSYMSNGYVMAEKEKRSLSEVEFLGDKLPTQEDIERAIERAALTIKYESMYGEKFVLDSDKLSLKE